MKLLEIRLYSNKTSLFGIMISCYIFQNATLSAALRVIFLKAFLKLKDCTVCWYEQIFEGKC